VAPEDLPVTTRVYRFGLLPPTGNVDAVREQLRAARNYQNDLVAIERGRRHAMRAIYETDEVREAEAAVVAATKPTRKAALQALRAARKAARDGNAEELERIAELDAEIRRAARALTPCYWGSYLDVEARHQQSRSAPLYADDGLTPSDPRFGHWREYGLNEGQIGVQIQGGLPTSEVFAAADTRVRIARIPHRSGRDWPRYGTLSLRVGSEGREPVWAEWPIQMHQAIPDNARWKWVRVSVRGVGARELWSCEITVDDPAPLPRSLDRELDGAIAVEWSWDSRSGESIRVASWADTRGTKGEVLLPARIAVGIRKADDLRAVRDLVANTMRPRLQSALQACKEPLPKFLREAAGTLHLWKSLTRLHELADKWLAEAPHVAPDAFAILHAWERGDGGKLYGNGDTHLWQYEANARHNALAWRKDYYRKQAAAWARTYRTILLSDQDLSKEARFGPESDVRFTVGCSELRQAARNAFGDEDEVESRWRDKPSEEDERAWCERTRDAWMAGGARGDGRFAKRKEKTTNAWAGRKGKKKAKVGENGTAREPGGNDAESHAV